MELKKNIYLYSCFKKECKRSYKQINILKIDNTTDCLENEITLNKNKEYKYLGKIILFLKFVDNL